MVFMISNENLESIWVSQDYFVFQDFTWWGQLCLDSFCSLHVYKNKSGLWILLPIPSWDTLVKILTKLKNSEQPQSDHQDLVRQDRDEESLGERSISPFIQPGKRIPQGLGFCLYAFRFCAFLKGSCVFSLIWGTLHCFSFGVILPLLRHFGCYN